MSKHLKDPKNTLDPTGFLWRIYSLHALQINIYRIQSSAQEKKRLLEKERLERSFHKLGIVTIKFWESDFVSLCDGTIRFCSLTNCRLLECTASL